jgi:hypothetical protein
MTKKKITIKTEHNYVHIITISAFRYALGRMSYVPSMFCEFFIQQWDILPDNTKKQIERELETALKDHEDPDLMFCLGDECDVVTWQKLLDFIKDKRNEEILQLMEEVKQNES